MIASKTTIATRRDGSNPVTPDMQRSAADTLDAAFTMVSCGMISGQM